ncbi:MAG: TSUP family transporter [bacterium]
MQIFDINYLTLIFLCVAAFSAGFIDSIAGGGGLISLPALLISGMPAHIALGTNKLQSACGTTLATINYGRKGKIIWRIALLGIPFALIGAALGAKLTLYFSPQILTKILVFLLPPATILMFLSNVLLKRGKQFEHKIKKEIIAIPLVCLMIGLYDGFYGPGTGTFLIVFMVLFANISLLNSSATSKTFNLASNIGALIAFMFAGSINYKLGFCMAGANIAGNYLGSTLAIKKGNAMVQKFVYLAISLLFIYLLFKN